MKTRMLIIPTMFGPVEETFVDLAPKPALDKLRLAIEPHLDGQKLERVRVLYEGEYRDMFVGEFSAKGIRNLRATEIYHNNARTAIARGLAERSDFPDPWPPVCGPAVLFPDRIVWT